MYEDAPSPEQAAKIRTEVRAKYRGVPGQPRVFPYPVGRESVARLGYEPGWIERVPAEVTERFVGVGNPFSQGRPEPGERVLDAGCGCGFDSFVSSLVVGARGAVVGVDLAPEMLAVADGALTSWPLRNARFVEASVEDLPFDDGSFDRVISNGALNLVPDKEAAFRQISRVLRPGGIFLAADLLVDEEIPDEILEGQDAWSN